MDFTVKTYIRAHRRAQKIGDQAMYDHINALRGPEMAVKWHHTALLIQRRWEKKVNPFLAFFH